MGTGLQVRLGRAKATPLGDRRYNARHGDRNRSRVDAIVAHCFPGEAALDIGCNAGYFSRALLNGGLARTIDAIEYDPEIVAPDLKADRRFHLYAGDAVDFAFRRRYHVSIYGAVHHHLTALHGYARAMKFWQDVVEHTDSLIFLESGQLAEGCRWYWQRALRRYYSADEDFFADLLFAIGPRLKSVRVISRHWIHGVRRLLFKIELLPLGASPVLEETGPTVRVEHTYRRTIGSKRQRLVPVGGHDEPRPAFDGVAFRVGVTPDGGKVFCKQYVASQKSGHELAIARQIADPRFVSPIGFTADVGLIFPFMDLPVLDSVDPSAVKDRKKLCREIESLFRFAEEQKVTIDYGGRRTLKLIDLVDLHACNLFYDEHGAHLLRAYDLELHSLANRPRNCRNLAKMLLRYGPHDIRTLWRIAACGLAYGWGLLLAALRKPEQRVMMRTVSISGWLYVRFREALDRLIIRMIPAYKE